MTSSKPQPKKQASERPTRGQKKKARRSLNKVAKLVTNPKFIASLARELRGKERRQERRWLDYQLKNRRFRSVPNAIKRQFHKLTSAENEGDLVAMYKTGDIDVLTHHIMTKVQEERADAKAAKGLPDTEYIEDWWIEEKGEPAVDITLPPTDNESEDEASTSKKVDSNGKKGEIDEDEDDDVEMAGVPGGVALPIRGDNPTAKRKE